MAHRAQLRFVKSVIDRFPHHAAGSVLEVGSLDVNGSCRQFFARGSYLGIDLQAGRGVDRVCRVQEVEGLFDVVLCCEVLEHDPEWRCDVAAMAHRLKHGGLLIITCAGPGRHEHGTRAHPKPGMASDTDHYRNVDVNELLAEIAHWQWDFVEATYCSKARDTRLVARAR